MQIAAQCGIARNPGATGFDHSELWSEHALRAEALRDKRPREDQTPAQGLSADPAAFLIAGYSSPQSSRARHYGRQPSRLDLGHGRAPYPRSRTACTSRPVARRTSQVYIAT
jgi:hypothetical protein